MPSRKGWSQNEYETWKERNIRYIVLREFMLTPDITLEFEQELIYNPVMNITAFIKYKIENDDVIELSQAHIVGLIEDGFIIKAPT